MTMHPHDKELAQKAPEERLRFEESFLTFTTAARIQNLLDGLGISQAELARRLGKSQAWVSRLLSGRQNLTLKSLARIGFTLGIRWDPEMFAAPREGTPAEEDPPLPAWVRAENEIEFEAPDFVGSLKRWHRTLHRPTDLPGLANLVVSVRASDSIEPIRGSRNWLTLMPQPSLDVVVFGEDRVVATYEGAVSGA